MALANENSFAIDPNELQSDEQIDHDINHAARPDNIWTLASTSRYDQ